MVQANLGGPVTSPLGERLLQLLNLLLDAGQLPGQLLLLRLLGRGRLGQAPLRQMPVVLDVPLRVEYVEVARVLQ